MLNIYTKLEDVPEALRGEYKLVGGKYVPDLSDDHPVLVNNRTLLTEKQTAETKAAGLQTEVDNLKADVQSAKANGLPRGHRAVTTAEADLIDKVKEHGTAEEVVAKLSEHKTLKEESAQRARETQLREVAKELGYDNADAFVRLPNLPEFEVRDKDGKKTVIAKVKENGNVVEKDAKEYLESSPDVAPFLAALKTKPDGTRVPEQRRDAGAPPANNVYDKVRDAVKTAEQNANPPSAVEQRFGIAQSA